MNFNSLQIELFADHCVITQVHKGIRLELTKLKETDMGVIGKFIDENFPQFDSRRLYMIGDNNV